MEVLNSIATFMQSPAFAGIMAGLFVISEALASIPSIEANSVFQMIRGLLGKFGKKDGA